MLQGEDLLAGGNVVYHDLLELQVRHEELAVPDVDAAGLLELLAAEGADPLAVQVTHEDALVALVGDEQVILVIHEHVSRTLQGLAVKLGVGSLREITGGRMRFFAGVDLRQGVVGRFIRPCGQGQKRQTEQYNQDALDTHGVLPFR